MKSTFTKETVMAVYVVQKALKLAFIDALT